MEKHCAAVASVACEAAVAGFLDLTDSASNLQLVLLDMPSNDHMILCCAADLASSDHTGLASSDRIVPAHDTGGLVLQLLLLMMVPALLMMLPGQRMAAKELDLLVLQLLLLMMVPALLLMMPG